MHPDLMKGVTGLFPSWSCHALPCHLRLLGMVWQDLQCFHVSPCPSILIHLLLPRHTVPLFTNWIFGWTRLQRLGCSNRAARWRHLELRAMTSSRFVILPKISSNSSDERSNSTGLLTGASLWTFLPPFIVLPGTSLVCSPSRPLPTNFSCRFLGPCCSSAPWPFPLFWQVLAGQGVPPPPCPFLYPELSPESSCSFPNGPGCPGDWGFLTLPTFSGWTCLHSFLGFFLWLSGSSDRAGFLAAPS